MDGEVNTARTRQRMTHTHTDTGYGREGGREGTVGSPKSVSYTISYLK